MKLIVFILLVILGSMEENYVWFLVYSHNLLNADFSDDIHLSI